MPGGVAPKFGSEKVSRFTGESQLQLRVSRYTVQLSRHLELPGIGVAIVYRLIFFSYHRVSRYTPLIRGQANQIGGATLGIASQAASGGNCAIGPNRSYSIANSCLTSH